MRRFNNENSHRRLEYSQPEEQPIISKLCINGSNMLKHLRNKLNSPCALFSILFILWWIQMMWNSSSFNNIGKYGLYVKQTNALLNNTLAAKERWMNRNVQISNPKKASWDLLGSPNSPSLYTKFNIDGEVYNLEVDTGSFLTWFRCNYKSYQRKIVPFMDPSCKKVTGKHFRAMSLVVDYPQLQKKDEGPCSYRIIYQDNSHSDGVIVKSNIQIQITDIVTGMSVMHMDETLLGCSYNDFNPNGEYKDAIDGLLGLGRSTYGVQVSFLKHGIPLCFGFCFKDFFGKKDETQVGYIFFGNHNLNYRSQIKWIDVPEYYIFGDEAYELRVIKLSIGDDVSIPINANMMFDTGTPLTFLEANLFETLIHYIGESAVNSGYTTYEEDLEHFKCWNFPEPIDGSSTMMEMLSFDFPDLKLEFSNGETFTISPTKYLATYAFIKNGICANMRKFDDGLMFPDNTMVLGARMMAEYLIIFDNVKDVIGFLPLPDCHYTKKRKYESNQISLQKLPKFILKNDHFE